jgi:hypothetical protein
VALPTVPTVPSAPTVPPRVGAAAAPPRPGASAPAAARSRRSDLLTATAVLGWVPLALVLDAAGLPGLRLAGGASIGLQRALGVATVVLLVALLARQDARTRAQVAIVIAFATAVEYVFSAGLDTYLYRLHGVPGADPVPWFVPPGHGLVYLGALTLGRAAAPRVLAVWRRATLVTVVVAGIGGLVVPLLAGSRPDALGAFWALCLAVFLLSGGDPGVYCGAFAVVTLLELVGTGLGVWTWQAWSPWHLVPQGNPPSGISGGYCWFDAAALAGAPLLLRVARRRTGSPAGLPVGG